MVLVSHHYHRKATTLVILTRCEFNLKLAMQLEDSTIHGETHKLLDHATGCRLEIPCCSRKCLGYGAY